MADRLSREHYELYAKPAQAYAAEFVKALVSLGETAPLVLAQDAFELIVGDSLPGEFRSLVVKPCLEKSAEIVFVLAGRTHQHAAYADTFDSVPRRLYHCGLAPLTVDEVADYLEAAQVPRPLAEAVHAESFGLPYELPGALESISRRTAATPEVPSKGGAADLIARLPGLAAAPSDSGEEVSRKAVERHRIYALALVRGRKGWAVARGDESAAVARSASGVASGID